MSTAQTIKMASPSLRHVTVTVTGGHVAKLLKVRHVRGVHPLLASLFYLLMFFLLWCLNVSEAVCCSFLNLQFFFVIWGWSLPEVLFFFFFLSKHLRAARDRKVGYKETILKKFEVNSSALFRRAAVAAWRWRISNRPVPTGPTSIRQTTAELQVPSCSWMFDSFAETDFFVETVGVTLTCRHDWDVATELSSTPQCNKIKA